MDKAIIHVEGLTKIFNAKLKAVDDVNFDIQEGEIFGFLGPNGAGKTSTILMLITLSKPTSGSASICNHDVVKEAMQVRNCIGYVSQDIAVDDQLTGRENLFLQGRFFHLPKNLLNQRIEEVLSMVDLTDRRNDLVATYSGGMRKRLDIAGGLIHRPKILFLDEPTLGLDIQTRHKIWEYIRKLRDEFKMTIFMTTHYMDEADELCDRIAIIDQGKIKAIDSPSNLKNELGGDVITIKFVQNKNEKFDRVEELTQNIKGLSNIGSITKIGDFYNIISRNGDTTIPKIFKIVEKFGISIDSVTLKRPSLDDVFLAYTGRALREEEGSREAALSDRIRLHRMRG